MQASYRQKCKFTPEAVCCNFGFDMRAIHTVPVDQAARQANTSKL